MNSIICPCPHCHFPLRLPNDSWLGQNARCPKCESRFRLKARPSPSGDTDALVANGEIKTEHQPESQLFKGKETQSAKPSWDQLIDGRYELIQRLGGGGFGVVWKARDVKLDRIVALKLPRQELFDADTARQIQREAQAAARLKHPNIVAVYEVKNDGQSIYIVSEYVEGITLTDWKEGQSISPRQAAEMGRNLATTIHHAHEMGIVHRDLKPGNVLIDSEGELHITDFGLAKRDDMESSLSEAGRAMGTPAYMSPEQARGESRQADRRTDLYSLGVMLFELLTGERPFRGTKWGALQYQILTQEAPKPRTLNPDIPQDLDTICLKCLEKDPHKRYSSAQELAEELSRFLNNEPILARPIGRFARLWRACKRQPMIASLTAVLVLVLWIGSFVSAYFGIKANQRAQEANLAKNDAVIERDKARKNEERAIDAETQLRLETDRLRIQQARQSVAEGDRTIKEYQTWPDHLLWYARALELSPEGSEEQRINRMRLASALAENPLEDFWPGVRFAAFSPDGKRIATTADDGGVVVYETATHKKLATLRTSNLPAIHAAFNSDGHLLVVVGHHKKASVWNVDSQQRIFESPELEDYPVWTTFNPTGDMLFILTDNGNQERHLKRFRFPGGQAEQDLNSDYHILDISPDAKKLLAKFDEKTAILIDSLSGTRIGKPMKHERPIRGGKFSPDGLWVATYSGRQPFAVPIGDLPPPAPPEDFSTGKETPSPRYPVAFQVPLVQDISQAQVWDAVSGEARTDPLACSFSINAVALSSDGLLLAAGGEADNAPPLPPEAAGQDLPKEGGHRLLPVLHQLEEPAADLSIPPQALLSKGRVQLWGLNDPQTRQRVEYVTGGINTLVFTPTGRHLISGGSREYAGLGGDEVICWTVDPAHLFQDQLLWRVEFAPRSIVFDPSGTRVLVSGSNYHQAGARLWNLNHSNSRGILDSSAASTIAVFSEDGKTIQGVGGSFSPADQLLTWEAATCKVVAQNPIGAAEERIRTLSRIVFESRVKSSTVVEPFGVMSIEEAFAVAVPVLESRAYLSIPAFRDWEEAWYRESQVTFDISSIQFAVRPNTEVIGLSPDQGLLILFERIDGEFNAGILPATMGQGHLRLVDAKTGRPRSRPMPMPMGGNFLKARMDQSQRLLAVVTGKSQESFDPVAPFPLAPRADAQFSVNESPAVAATIYVWDVITETLVMYENIPNETLGEFIQFDEQGQRFLVKLNSGLHLFDLLPEWMPTDEMMQMLAKWAAFGDIDETGSVGEINPQIVNEAWGKLIR